MYTIERGWASSEALLWDGGIEALVDDAQEVSVFEGCCDAFLVAQLFVD